MTPVAIARPTHVTVKGERKPPKPARVTLQPPASSMRSVATAKADSHSSIIPEGLERRGLVAKVQAVIERPVVLMKPVMRGLRVAFK